MTDTAVDLDKLTQPFPKEAIKQRIIGGGKKADYIDGASVIRRLNEATGYCWDFTVDRYWTEDNKTLALVTLTLPGLGARQHIGVQALDNRSGEDAAAKGAITDALKKAATLFGVGLETYADEHEAAPNPTTPRQMPQDAPEPLTDDQEWTIAEARAMAEEQQPYPAVVNHLRQLQTGATPDQWTLIRRALAAIKAAHYAQPEEG